MRLFWAYTLSVCLAGAAISGCGHDKKNTAKTPLNGHQRMIAILDSIYKKADPENCYNLNSRMAAKYAGMLEMAKTPEQQVVLRFKYAEQLLYAGLSQDAIREIEAVMQMYGNKLSQKNKIVFELYALAYLRMGEQQNCVQNHSSESCIVPIQGGGIHKLTEGSTKAIEIYTQILDAFPDDLQSRWLLNVAYMTLGKYPNDVPAKYRIPESVFKGDQRFEFHDIAVQLGLDRRGVSGGVCMEDFDNDGNLDLFMTSYLLNDQCRFYHNNGDGTFTDRTKEANLTGIVSGLNTIHADYDNDGDRDILILRGGWLDGGWHPNSLLRNNGDGTFTDVTIEAGLLSFHPTQTGVWADFNGDGWLDLFIGNESSQKKGQQPCELFLNNKNGTFTNVAAQVGLNLTGYFKAAVAGDINNDRLPDLYLSCLDNDNQLFVNRTTDPAHMKFENITQKAGVQNPKYSFPAWFFDYDNDGNEDIFVCGYVTSMIENAAGVALAEYLGKQPPGDYARLYHNNGNETFTDVTKAYGLNKIMFGMGSNFGDLDNDGWLDFYVGTGTPDFRSLVPNRMFHNVAGKRFEEISMDGFAHIQKGHGVAFGDLDNDGDQDIYCVMGGAYEGDQANNILFENPGNNNKWLTVFVEGKTANRDGRGAKVIVTVRNAQSKTRKIYATVNTGGSFGASSLRQEIGLGDATAVESVEVQWPQPGPASTIIKNAQPNTAIKITEGASEATLVNLKTFKLTGGGVKSGGHNHS